MESRDERIARNAAELQRTRRSGAVVLALVTGDPAEQRRTQRLRTLADELQEWRFACEFRKG
jgi:hypothetical protein